MITVIWALVGFLIGVAATLRFATRGLKQAAKWEEKADDAEARCEVLETHWKNALRLLHDCSDDLAIANLEIVGLRAQMRPRKWMRDKPTVHRCAADENAQRDEARREGWPEAQKQAQSNEEGSGCQ